MSLSGRIFCILKAVLLAFAVTFLFRSAFVTGSSDCAKYDITCDNGECIEAGLWCDTYEDCSDKSDEKYCKTISLFNNDPNKCSSKYFRCNNGPCIPLVGRCDGIENCFDSSDEEMCDQETSPESVIGISATTASYHTLTSTTILPPNNQMDGANAALYFASINASQNSVQATPFQGFSFYSLSEQRNKARNWILSEKNNDFGWGDETPRSIAALFLSDNQPIVKNTESYFLMIKQLEIRLFIEISRNETKPVKLTDLALYINALLVSCKDPKNFYGDNLVSILRERVNAAQEENTFVNPSIYLTLCLNNATTYNDIMQLHDIFFKWNATISKLNMQSLALLTTACVFQKTNLLNSSMFDSIKKEFLRNVKAHGFPGNVYEAALLFQALQEMKITLAGLSEFILKKQKADGSFGDILATYLVLPILAGRNLVHMIDFCGQQNTPDLIPLEVLRNVKSKKMHVQYSLNYGVPPQLTRTLQMHVTKGTSFLDIMRLAQEIDSKYRFKLNENREVPVVYSIGEIPNDAERGIYWTLYKASGNGTEITGGENWASYDGDIKKLILTDEDKVLFWYRPV